jgi:hypothetical protein
MRVAKLGEGFESSAAAPTMADTPQAVAHGCSLLFQKTLYQNFSIP